MGVLSDIGRLAGGAAEGFEAGQRIAASQQASYAAAKRAGREQEEYDQSQDAAEAAARLAEMTEVDQDFDMRTAAQKIIKDVADKRTERQKAEYEASPAGRMRSVVRRVMGRNDARTVGAATDVGLPATPEAAAAAPGIRIAASTPGPGEAPAPAPAPAPSTGPKRQPTARERAFLDMVVAGKFRQPEFKAAKEAYANATLTETAANLNRLSAGALTDKLNEMGKPSGTTFSVTPNKGEDGKAPTFTLSVNGEVQRTDATAPERMAWVRGLVANDPEAANQAMNLIHNEEEARRTIEQQRKLRAQQLKEAEFKLKEAVKASGRGDAAAERAVAELREEDFDDNYMSNPEAVFDDPNSAGQVIYRASKRDPEKKNQLIWRTEETIDPETGEKTTKVINRLQEQADAALAYRQKYPQKAMIQERVLDDGRHIFAVLDVNGVPIRETAREHWREAAEIATQKYGDKPVTPTVRAPAAAAAAPAPTAPGLPPKQGGEKRKEPAREARQPVKAPTTYAERAKEGAKNYLAQPGRKEGYQRDVEFLRKYDSRSDKVSTSGLSAIKAANARERVKNYEKQAAIYRAK